MPGERCNNDCGWLFWQDEGQAMGCLVSSVLANLWFIQFETEIKQRDMKLFRRDVDHIV